MKPIIGVVLLPYLDIDNEKAYQAPTEIMSQIVKYGGLPIGISSMSKNNNIDEKEILTYEEKNNLKEVLKICDGIIKPGAYKIYRYEKYIYECAKELNMPYLGICAGMQLMNEDKIIRNKSSINHKSKQEYVHSLKILKDTLLYNILKKEEILVNSRHNYHIDEASNFTISALSPDGIIEGIEDKNLDYHLGLQWHPESLNDDNTKKIFESFIESAKKYHKTK